MNLSIHRIEKIDIKYTSVINGVCSRHVEIYGENGELVFDIILFSEKEIDININKQIRRYST